MTPVTLQWTVDRSVRWLVDPLPSNVKRGLARITLRRFLMVLARVRLSNDELQYIHSHEGIKESGEHEECSHRRMDLGIDIFL